MGLVFVKGDYQKVYSWCDYLIDMFREFIVRQVYVVLFGLK